MSHTKRRGESPQRVAIAIMAAGKGTRLKSKHPKVLHEVGGKPLLAHVIAAATKVVSAQDIYAIIGHEAERRSEEHTSELQSRENLVCRLLLEKKKTK